MVLRNVKWFIPDEPPEAAWDACRRIAVGVAVDANRSTSAPIGITVRDTTRDGKRVIVVGPRGAAAYPVEFGTAHVRARRPVKKAVDRARQT